MTKLLSGKVALVTGGTRGIGYSIVETLASQGANVAFTFVSSEEKAKQISDKLSTDEVKVFGIKSDAGSYEQAEQTIESVIKEFGKIDILVNNAGITRDNLLLRMSEQQFDEVIQANLKSVFNLTKHVSKHMLRAKQGSIINLTSIIGLRGQAGQANYAASKAGIIGFTKSIADEFASRSIRCNAVSPGFIETDMTQVLSPEVKAGIMKQIPFGRMGSAQEVANAVLFLASDLSTYVSGQVLSVCGAMSR
ncbi:MAG: 3-oxoacyl-[acyl-carrier-protein] reductase [Chitinophagales bacterium]|nr:3-oxoacyl-[acyl-carrier-protein] reductase [Chitinophagales bacterium]OJV31238.1 MAG: 3-oxoacyl-[acyl-carrier-protein] reductase [Bacteroidetes bacterium 37-13]HRN93713.1 3-oxoacyl-[acyl-carrier-protein] reductase [Chitinophagales bacterium]HRP40458.1 3-oxoacyl-[acyl-carrier-protein] reductase [Chitinophagales bacterium]